MNKLLLLVTLMISLEAKADLVKIKGALAFVEPISRVAKYVRYSDGTIVQGKDVAIVSSNLIKIDGSLASVNPGTGKIDYIRSIEGKVFFDYDVSTK